MLLRLIQMGIGNLFILGVTIHLFRSPTDNRSSSGYPNLRFPVDIQRHTVHFLARHLRLSRTGADGSR